MTTRVPRTVADIMTRDVVTVDEDDNLTELLEAMGVMRFRHLPVTDDDHLVGLLTERDVLGISASTLLPHGKERDRFLKQQFHVRDVMTKQVSTVFEHTPLRDAARTMLRDKIGCLPVVNENNVLVGIVTSSDFIRLCEELLVAGS